MKQYWYIFLFAILCAVFSKQIDIVISKANKDSKKRAVLYCIVGGVALAVIGYLIYGAVQPFMQGHNAIALAIAPVSLFAVGIIAGICFAKARKKKQENN